MTKKSNGDYLPLNIETLADLMRSLLADNNGRINKSIPDKTPTENQLWYKSLEGTAKEIIDNLSFAEHSLTNSTEFKINPPDPVKFAHDNFQHQFELFEEEEIISLALSIPDTWFAPTGFIGFDCGQIDVYRTTMSELFKKCHLRVIK